METAVISRRKFRENKQAVTPAEAVKDDTAYTKEEFEAILAQAFAEKEAGLGRVLTKERQKELLGI
ncbi:hypothetical protein Barb4_01426 [Bacteroidales bacterium Barb4]|nr:hypothetical protein Barb4_01426 [Bacteroidales bacterium Barb4]